MTVAVKGGGSHRDDVVGEDECRIVAIVVGVVVVRELPPALDEDGLNGGGRGHEGTRVREPRRVSS